MALQTRRRTWSHTLTASGPDLPGSKHDDIGS